MERQNENENLLNFLDESGKMRPLDQIQKDVENLYKKIEEEAEECTLGLIDPNSCLNAILKPEDQIDGISIVNSFAFLARNLYITDEITPETSHTVCSLISFWNNIDEIDDLRPEERLPINIYIDTPGGDLDATFSMIDSIQLSKTPIYTITTGQGYSGGFLIGLVGHKRIGYPHSTYLFHEGSAAQSGDAHKFIQGVKFYESRLNDLKKITLDNTKITEKEYLEHKKDDLWLTAEEALAKGIIDEIATEVM